MKINSSNVYMESNHKYEAQKKSGTIQTIGNKTNVYENAIGVQREEANKNLDFTKMLKEEMIDESTEDMQQSMLGLKSNSATVSKIASVDDLKSFRKVQEHTIMYLLKHFRELMQQGRYRHWNRNRDISVQDGTLQPFRQGVNGNENPNIIGSSTFYDIYAEEENMSFATKGKVVTADGREIEFGVDVQMTRSFEEYYVERNDIYAEPNSSLVDPLVINLQGTLSGVSDQKFVFDLDADGKKDNISMLNAGSGFLALDKNKDGVINDGSELFGTKSGNGFRDLAEYDLDGNGWIDENDEIFDALKIWTKDASGKDVLYTLKEAGVGAICLQSAKTEFSMNSLQDNHVNGVIRQTGIFLYENGGVGTMQHLDLAT